MDGMADSSAASSGPIYQDSCDITKSHQPTQAVVEAIATIEGVSPLELSPLYEFVDPDALNTVFTGEESTDEDITVTFAVDDWCVEVDASGRLVVYSGSEAKVKRL